MRERRTFEAKTHAVGRVADRVGRRLQHVERIRREIVLLWTGQHADPCAPLGQREQRRARLRAHRVARPHRIAKRYAIARLQRPPIEPAHRADDVRRAAAERRRHADAARHRDVGARASQPPAESQTRSRRDDKRRVRRHVPPIDGQLEFGARHRDHPLIVELELRADQRDLERRRVDVVAGQRIGKAVRAGIHRARDRHAARLQSPTAAILNRGEEARLDNEEMAHVSRS